MSRLYQFTFVFVCLSTLSWCHWGAIAQEPILLHAQGREAVFSPDWEQGVRNLGPSLARLKPGAQRKPFPEEEVDVVAEEVVDDVFGTETLFIILYEPLLVVLL